MTDLEEYEKEYLERLKKKSGKKPKPKQTEHVQADEVDFWLEKYRTYDGMENSEEASACLDKALELDPDKSVEVEVEVRLKKMIAKQIEFNQTKKTYSNSTADELIEGLEILADLEERREEIMTMGSKFSTMSVNAKTDLLKKLKEYDSIQEKFAGIGEKVLEKTQEYSLYEILGVSSNASQKEIQSRFRELSLKLHPDKETSALSLQITKQIIEAYNTLKDPKKRKEYDDTL